MDDESEIGGISREDVIDAIADIDNEGGLTLLTEYYNELLGKSPANEKRIQMAVMCANLLLDAKRYEDVAVWLDDTATLISDTEGPDSEAYMNFAESEELEELKMKALDKASGAEEELDLEYDDDE